VPPLVEDPHEQEEGARGEPVVDALKNRAGGRERRQCRNSEHDEAEMRDRRVRDEPLHVRLGEGDHRSVHDADDRKRAEPRREPERRLGKERQREAAVAIPPELEEHPPEEAIENAKNRSIWAGIGKLSR
jgi:hypothetical protein